ncbi:MAG: hypothetical protein WA571_14890 [Candidatus Binatus sp.]
MRALDYRKSAAGTHHDGTVVEVICPLWSSNDIKKMAMRAQSWLWIRPEKLDVSAS